MAHILDLDVELLTFIMIFVVMEDTGATDWARAAATCKKIRTAALDIGILMAINGRNVKQVGHCESLHHINGVLSRCSRTVNKSADYFLAKAMLAGGPALWKTIMENYLTCSSIKCATALPLSERHYIAKSLTTGSIADVPYILFFSDDTSYRRLYHIKLILTFILLVDLQELVPLCHALKDFMEFFIGCCKYYESGLHDKIFRMCWEESIAIMPVSDEMLMAFWLPRPPLGSPSYREQVMAGLDNLLCDVTLPW